MTRIIASMYEITNKYSRRKDRNTGREGRREGRRGGRKLKAAHMHTANSQKGKDAIEEEGREWVG